MGRKLKENVRYSGTSDGRCQNSLYLTFKKALVTVPVILSQPMTMKQAEQILWVLKKRH